MAMPRNGAALGSAVAPADITAALRRVTGTWSQPEPWTVAVLLVTGVVVIARHPLARMIGTEVDSTSTVPSVVATAPAVPSAAPTSAPAAAAVEAVPTHAPRDPFRSLVGAGGNVLAPEAPAAAAAATARQQPVTPTTPTTTRPAVAHSATCAGTAYTVVSGDTLWTIAARVVKSSDTQRVTVAWHRIYRANRPPLSDPSLLLVGAKLCLPASI